jgi:1-acyl-sn-glycerol-3-phosphate acyltransferase
VHDIPTRSRDRLPLLLALPYTVYAVTLFVTVALVALLVILPLPSLRWRRIVVRAAARLGLALVGMRVVIRGGDRLPPGPCVVVANHASYIDGVVLKAALPARFAFVIKREMNDVPLAGLLLRRIGAQFVDRGKGQRGARDARRVLRTASSGASLAFFPEGTFEPEPGLLRFHSGAFVIAVRNGLPVVPLVIHGARRALPPGFRWPGPARIRIDVLEALTSTAEPPDHAVVELRRRARAAILARLGEPDRHPDPPVAG